MCLSIAYNRLKGRKEKERTEKREKRKRHKGKRKKKKQFVVSKNGELVRKELTRVLLL